MELRWPRLTMVSSSIPFPASEQLSFITIVDRGPTERCWRFSPDDVRRQQVDAAYPAKGTALLQHRCHVSCLTQEVCDVS